jgi:branched-chain amino acid transport system substrate-binding protein
MSGVKPARIGLLWDYITEGQPVGAESHPDVMQSLQLVVDEYLEKGILDRPVEFVLRHVQGLPKGSFKAVRDAFYELVEEDCLVIYGPWVSENGAPLRDYVEDLAEVPIITMAGTETMLGDFVFAVPAGSLEEEPIVMAQVAWYDGARSAGIAYEDSLIGHEYLRSARAACRTVGIRITGEVAVPQVETEKREALAQLAAGKPDCMLHVGFGLGLVGMNAALKEIGWDPPRYTTTAFEFAANNDWWRNELAGWIGLDQYDERNMVAQEFLDRFEARYGRRPAYYFPLFCYDVGRLMLTAIATAKPLTGRGVKEALERIKMMPAAVGAPGTRLRFGKYIRQGWVGSEFLVARRVLPDGSKIVMHGTIEGLVKPAD